MRYTSSLVALAIAGMSISLSTHAVPVTFMGEDLNPGGDPNVLSAYPASTGARSLLFANLSGVGTETFDSLVAGSTSPTVTFSSPSGSILATLQGGTIVADPRDRPVGRYAISAPNFLRAGTGGFSVTFDRPIAAFGFFGVDVGDFGGALALRLTNQSGVITTLEVGNVLGTCDNSPCFDPTSGSVLYFGFYDLADQYQMIEFVNNSEFDQFAFDDFSVGTSDQLVPVPEVPSHLLLLLGLSAVVPMIRRQTAPRSTLGEA